MRLRICSVRIDGGRRWCGAAVYCSIDAAVLYVQNHRTIHRRDRQGGRADPIMPPSKINSKIPYPKLFVVWQNFGRH